MTTNFQLIPNPLLLGREGVKFKIMSFPPLFEREGVGGEFEESDYVFSVFLTCTLSPVAFFDIGIYLKLGICDLILYFLLSPSLPPSTVFRMP